MNPQNHIAQMASRANGNNGHSGPPPGWPFNLPSRAALNYLEQALTEDRPRPDWYGSEIVVLDDEGRYVWSWSMDTPLGRRVLGSNVYEVQDGTTGERGLMFAHTLRQQRRAVARTHSYTLSRVFAPAGPGGDAVPSRATLATQPGSQAPSAQQVSHSYPKWCAFVCMLMFFSLQSRARRNGGPPMGGGRILARGPTLPIVFQLPREQAVSCIIA